MSSRLSWTCLQEIFIWLEWGQVLSTQSRWWDWFKESSPPGSEEILRWSGWTFSPQKNQGGPQHGGRKGRQSRSPSQGPSDLPSDISPALSPLLKSPRWKVSSTPFPRSWQLQEHPRSMTHVTSAPQQLTWWFSGAPFHLCKGEIRNRN